MADLVYRGNLKAASFPLLSEFQGRTVIVKGQDQNFVSGLAAKESLDSSLGIPQIYYCHNVMPNDNGYQSIGYTAFSTAAAGLTGSFVSVVRLSDSAGNIVQFAHSETGQLFVLKSGSAAWIDVTGTITGIAGKHMTVATVSGVTYIYFANVGCYSYDYSTDVVSAVTLTGLTASDIIGIAEARGYLIAYSKDAIAWSSVIDPTDFVPSLETGAGGGNIEEARGTIVTAIPVTTGLVLFTTANAVAAISSDNPRYPFNFSEIVGSGGLSDPEYASYDTNTGAVYAYTTSGLQVVSLKSANNAFPELTDFLSGSIFEDFNEISNTFSSTYLNASMIKRLTVVASRYLVVSYGVSTLTHAIVYDIAYKQFGRLKKEHVDCFEFSLYDQSLVETPRKSIGLIDATGVISVVDFDHHSPTSNGVILLGKFQYVRSRMLTLQGVDVENVRDDATFTLHDLPTIDGKTFQPAIVGYLSATAARARSYKFHNTAMNHSILGKGKFNLNSIILTFTVHGAR